MSDHLRLKWGSLKGWELESAKSMAALKAYWECGEHSVSIMQDRDTAEQKEKLCALIDAIDGEIQNDWTGETMTKDEAKKYVLEYGKTEGDGRC